MPGLRASASRLAPAAAPQDAPREATLERLLGQLDYQASGRHRLDRGRALPQRRGPAVAPFAPTYVLVADGRPACLVEANAPRGRLDDPTLHRQLYRYATHPTVGAGWYALSDGEELALHDVDDPRRTPSVRGPLADSRGILARALSPRGLIARRGPVHRDLGLHLSRLGAGSPVAISVDALHPVLSRPEARAVFRYATSVSFEGETYLAALELDAQARAELDGDLGRVRLLVSVAAGAPSTARAVPLRVVGLTRVTAL